MCHGRHPLPIGLNVIDTKPILLEAAHREGKGIESYYRPDDHLNEQGNRVVAQALVDQFVEGSD
jgi:hypothetical protein